MPHSEAPRHRDEWVWPDLGTLLGIDAQALESDPGVARYRRGPLPVGVYSSGSRARRGGQRIGRERPRGALFPQGGSSGKPSGRDTGQFAGAMGGGWPERENLAWQEPSLDP